MKKLTSKYLITILFLILIFLVLIGSSSYAYYQKNYIQTNANIFSTLSCLNITFTSNNSSINLQNTYPLSDEEGLSTTPYNFTITNNCNSSVQYELLLAIVPKANQLNSGYVKIAMDGDNKIDTLLVTELSVHDTPQELISQGITQTYLLESNLFKTNQNHTMDFRIWIDGENESIWTDPNVENKDYEVKLTVIGIAKTSLPWGNPVNGSLLKLIKDNNPVTTPTTIPGREISASEEALLASAPDDYGTSYYFRGAVENNYVEFAGMCWRIVRVVGDGSIKLVLYNNNESGAANPCSVSSSTAAFARHTGTTYTSAFNSTSDQNAYVGFMYGTPGSSTYAAEHANNTKSTILENLETWYELDSKFASYENQLADTIWCNDKSIDTAYPYGNSLGYAANQTGYSARGRDGWYATEANPSLVCPNDSEGGKLSKFTVDDEENGNGNLTYKIGLLTADEAVYAGAILETANSTYYLRKNATCCYWWTLSPYCFNGDDAYVGEVAPAGNLLNSYVYYTGGLCPAVSLNSDVLAIGSGTVNDPYKIVKSFKLTDVIFANNSVTEPVTTPGRVISASGEAVLASTTDDYGTSYYFRGAVQNNYVEFADMCWRIVRVVGDGSIKLVLYNYNPNSVENPCDESQDGSSNAFARYSGPTYTSAFNSTTDRNAYIGFMYGNGSTYALEHENNTKSTILTNLELWYNRDSKFASYENMLADTIWCNDKSHYSGNGYHNYETFYSAGKRLIPAASASPSLVCPNDSAGGKLSKFTKDDEEKGNGKLDKKIGLLTADEVAFAGGIYNTANSTYYLYKNATTNPWWSLSPYYFGSANARMWYVNNAGYLHNNYVYVTVALRPSVSLVSTTKITSGNGTSSSPYIILTT